jgi:predicted nucleic acid-binding protein
LLLDTGPVVAVLRRADMDREPCLALLERSNADLVSTEAVLTEATHLVSGLPHGIAACIDFFIRMKVRLVPMTPRVLLRCREFTERYADVPMDFADATLVAVAEETGVRDIFTLDHRGFSTYRFGKKQAFRIVPG